ncbi:MAG: hypothetical protein V4739_16565 [Pseudomonadota bacterium]
MSAAGRPVNAWRLATTGSLAVALVAGLAWAALAPLSLASRDELFEIPAGTYARRMAGDAVEILPDTIHLTLGVNDVLLLRNLDEVPQIFGPTLIMPGQSFRLPFEVASTYSFACTAHASGQMSVVVSEPPAPGWSTLKWRWQRWTGRPTPAAAATAASASSPASSAPAPLAPSAAKRHSPKEAP